jgi:hypothetical protein
VELDSATREARNAHDAFEQTKNAKIDEDARVEQIEGLEAQCTAHSAALAAAQQTIQQTSDALAVALADAQEKQVRLEVQEAAHSAALQALEVRQLTASEALAGRRHMPICHCHRIRYDIKVIVFLSKFPVQNMGFKLFLRILIWSFL